MMTTLQYADSNVIHGAVRWAAPTSYYSRPAWTAELRQIEAQIFAAAGVTWS
jgi:hypothetical protein